MNEQELSQHGALKQDPRKDFRPGMWVWAEGMRGCKMRQDWQVRASQVGSCRPYNKEIVSGRNMAFNLTTN